MAAESELNKRVRAAMGGHDPVRVENTVGNGTPDINFAGGWIEDKAVPFPKRGGVVRIDHYTAQQRGWHRRRRAAGGVVLVAVEDTATGAHYLFDAWSAAAHLGVDWTSADCQNKSMCYLPSWNAKRFRDAVLKAVASPRQFR